MSELFITVLNMSLSASWIVLVVLVLRKVLNKAPKWIHVMLWGIVAIRLICPITIESVVSLMPSAEVVNPTILIETPSVSNEITTLNTGIPVINDMINPVINNTVLEIAVRQDINILQVITNIFSKVWFIGVIGFVIYTIISCLRIDKRIQNADLLSDNIYQSTNVQSPFVFGVIKPRIYLPSNLSEQDRPYVIAHEKMHIQRKDHLWKPIGFILLSIYWFNPILWLAYILLCKDIELACDEKVILALNHEQRADYSQSLLSCSVKQHMITACPIAFGEVGVKDRVKQVITYKKPSFWLIVIAIIISVVTGASFLTSPITTTDKVIKRVEKLDYKVVNQLKSFYTLSLDTSKLSQYLDDSEHVLNENEIVVFNDYVSSKIYLSKIKPIDTDDKYMVLEFAFDYDLDLDNGSLLSPYVIKENNLKPLDFAEYHVVENHVGEGYGFYFYVSKDVLQTKETIDYEIFLNRITYFDEVDAYSQFKDFVYPNESRLAIHINDEAMYYHTIDSNTDVQFIVNAILKNKIITTEEYSKNVSNDRSAIEYHITFKMNDIVYEYAVDKNGYGYVYTSEKGFPGLLLEAYLRYDPTVYSALNEMDAIYEYHLSNDTKEWMRKYEKLSNEEQLAMTDYPEDLLQAIRRGFQYKYATNIMGPVYFTSQKEPATMTKGAYIFPLYYTNILEFLNSLSLEVSNEIVGNELVKIQLDKEVIIYDNYLLKYDGIVYKITSDISNEYYWLVFNSEMIPLKDYISKKDFEKIVVSSYGTDLFEVHLKGNAKEQFIKETSQFIVMKYALENDRGAGGYTYRVYCKDTMIEVSSGGIYIYEDGELITNKQSALINGSLVGLVDTYLPTHIESLKNYEDDFVRIKKISE